MRYDPGMKFRLFLFGFVVVFGAVSSLHAAELNTSSTLVDTTPASEVPASPTQFDSVIDDLPLMQGLTSVPDQATSFTTPNGRIVETVATGLVDVDGVYDFYRRTLPHLGWQMVDARTYRRGNDHLRIKAHADGKVTTVRFSIRPQ